MRRLCSLSLRVDSVNASAGFPLEAKTRVELIDSKFHCDGRNFTRSLFTAPRPS